MRTTVFNISGHAPLRRQGSDLPPRPWLLGVGMATFLGVACLILIAFSWSDIVTRSLYANTGMVPIGLAAAILARGAALRQTDARSGWAWRLVGAAFACFCGGDLLFFVYQNVLGRSPFPSLADAGYLIYYPLMLAGLLLLPGRPGGRDHRWWRYAGSAVLLLGGGVCILEFLLIPVLGEGASGSFLTALSLGYPLGDLLLLAGIAATTFRGSGGRCRTMAVLAAGVCAGLSADIVFGYQNVQGTSQSGGLSDILYIASWLFYAWAAYVEATHRPFVWPEIAEQEHRT